MLPAVAGLLAAGLPLTPVMIFLATSPLMSTSAFLITLGGLGWPFALGKLGSALAVGILVGLSTEALLRTGWLRGQVQPDIIKHVSPSPGST